MRTLDQHGAGIGSGLEYIPYFEPRAALARRLDEAGGEFLYQPMGKDRSLYILGDVKRITRALALEVKWPVDQDPDWSIAHLAYLACDDAALARAFAFEAMEARWQRGENIWCWDKVKSLLAAIGTPAQAAQIVQRAQSEEVAARAVDALYRAYLDGVFGVPFAIAGREKFWGNDRIALFLETMREQEQA
jgi:2-hydroxychromene-2-carboxylate isomerase